jgi:DNA helicase-2/ATP-dependent DNA helicase PcrA
MDEILLPGLTPAQRAAIEHTGGPLLIVAGPGAGKTDVMVRRAAYLVRHCGVAAENLLVTTFTHKAADELHDGL